MVAGTVPRDYTVLVKAAPEGPWVRRGGTHARLLRTRIQGSVALLLMMVRGDWLSSRGEEPNRRGRGDGSAEADTGRAGGSGENGFGSGGEGGG